MPQWAFQIARNGQKTITLNKEETQRIQKVFPNFGKGPGKAKIQPVTVSSVPGLLKINTTPVKRTRRGYTSQTELTNLTIINPTNGILKLPNPVKIRQRRSPRFIKRAGENNAKACLVLGPSSRKHLTAITQGGTQVKIDRIQAKDIEHGAI